MNKQQESALASKIFDCYTEELIIVQQCVNMDLSYHVKKVELLEKQIAVINKRIELNNLYVEMKKGGNHE